MKRSKRVAAVIGVVCGAELVAAIAIGGAGFGAVFGWNGAVLALLAVSLIGALVYRHIRSTDSTGDVSS